MPVFRFLVVGFALLGAIAACGRGDSPSASGSGDGAPRDDFGATISLPVDPAHEPRRIVSLNPTTTEILFAIGAGPRVVGRSQFDVFPAEAARVPSLGLALRPNVEGLIAAHPDLVVLYASDDNRRAAERLRHVGIATAAFRIDRIEQFERDSRLLGRMTGDSARAAFLADSVAATLARVRAATASVPRPTVFLHAWDRPIIAIGGGSFMSELLDIAGARNVYADVSTPSATVTLEDVVRRNPDLVLASPITAPKMRSSDRWRAVPAVRAGHVLVYDTALVGRPSAGLGAAARSLAELIHPGSTRGLP
jgi:ABC-type Fe3+-hydroxamate transport system substrate-binding protein